MAKRLPLFSLVAVVVVLLFAVPALADTASVTLTAVSGGTQGGVYTSPYYATVGTVNGVAIVCDDYNHDVFIGESWTAYVYNFSDLSKVRFQGANPTATLQMYDEAAYLITMLAANPSAGGDISFAIWGIFSPNVLTTPGYLQGNANLWLTQAQNQTYYAGEYSNFLVLTPTQGGVYSPQEYIVMTPEPASILLLCGGLLALAIWSRRVKAAAQVCS